MNQELDISMKNVLDKDTKLSLRYLICKTAERFLNIPYEFGAEWSDYSNLPKTIDCSELVEGVFTICNLKIPDGSQSQYNFTHAVNDVQIGDLAFFGREKNPLKIYHVGIVFFNSQIIEARAFDPSVQFETGKVILRPLEKWKNYKNFCGFRSHPKLI